MSDTSVPPTVLITYPLPEEALQIARARAQVDLHTQTTSLGRDHLIARLKGRRGLICLITDLIDDAPSLLPAPTSAWYPTWPSGSTMWT